MSNHITISNTIPRIRYVSNGVLSSYTFPFAIFKASDLKVYFGSTLQDSSTYTVSGAGQSEGGRITLSSVPANGVIITLTRELAIERTTDFQEGGTLRSDALNHELDYQIACQQQIADNLNRSMVLPAYAVDTNVDLSLPLPSAGKAIVWGPQGTTLENSTVAVNELENTIRGYKTAAETAATTATTQAQAAATQASNAATQANTATQQATIATQKAAEASSAASTKANKNLDNITSDGKKVIVNAIMPSSSSVSFTLPAAGLGGDYTAPADGYFSLRVRVATACSSIAITNAQGMRTTCFSPGTNLQCAVVMPVKKNYVVNVYVYDYSTNSGINHLKFFYAQGEI